jgi:hypothetical protein
MIDPPYRLEERPPTRVLVGGIGLPWLRDLDFGTQFLKRIDDVEWPDGVVLEDLSYSAHRVLHTLKRSSWSGPCLATSIPPAPSAATSSI